MSTEIEQLHEHNAALEARNMWLENVVPKLIVMVGNAANVLEEYVKTTEQLRAELEKTRDVYSRLHADLEEAFNESPDNEDRLPETESPDATP